MEFVLAKLINETRNQYCTWEHFEVWNAKLNTNRQPTFNHIQSDWPFIDFLFAFLLPFQRGIFIKLPQSISIPLDTKTKTKYKRLMNLKGSQCFASNMSLQWININSPLDFFIPSNCKYFIWFYWLYFFWLQFLTSLLHSRF